MTPMASTLELVTRGRGSWWTQEPQTRGPGLLIPKRLTTRTS